MIQLFPSIYVILQQQDINTPITKFTKNAPPAPVQNSLNNTKTHTQNSPKFSTQTPKQNKNNNNRSTPNL